MSRWICNLLYKMRKRRFCKLNGWFCPDCIYHDFIFEGAIFRGNKCRYPRQTEREGEWIYTSDQSGYIGNPVEKCSVCGVEYEQAPFNYCPNCGAKMKGE